jgi:opacity protein-like surface antigen
MRIKSVIVLAIVLLFGTKAFAQDYPKVEVLADYSYIHANPQNNNIIKPFSLNGGGGSAAFYFSRFIGIEGEFEGYGSFNHSIVIPGGSAACPAGCVVVASGNLFTYNVGPVVKYRTSHFEPFVEALFGGAHSNFYGNVFTSCGGTLGCVAASSSPSNNAFDFLIGGGLDIPITKSIAFRPVQFDYLLTRFGTGFTGGNNNQSNLRYQAGVTFRF